jgi:protein TonB
VRCHACQSEPPVESRFCNSCGALLDRRVPLDAPADPPAVPAASAPAPRAITSAGHDISWAPPAPTDFAIYEPPPAEQEGAPEPVATQTPAVAVEPSADMVPVEPLLAMLAQSKSSKGDSAVTPAYRPEPQKRAAAARTPPRTVTQPTVTQPAAASTSRARRAAAVAAVVVIAAAVGIPLWWLGSSEADGPSSVQLPPSVPVVAPRQAPAAAVATVAVPPRPAPSTTAGKNSKASRRVAASARKSTEPPAPTPAEKVVAMPVPTPAPAPPPPVAAAATEEEVEPAKGRLFDITQVDDRPTVLSRVDPTLPGGAGGPLSDVVIVRILVTQAGRAASVGVARASRSGLGVDAAVLAAVRQWRFSPARRKGQAVSCWFHVGVPVTVN